jgi:hypothetical protein
MMTEEFLQFTWMYRLFDTRSLSTTSDETLEIIKPGEHNTDGGPDFTNARIKIGSTTWAGNIEIHLNASDWKKHNHHRNKAYDNIILHVVFNNDYTAIRKSKEPIPILELNELIPNGIFRKYKNIINSKQWIPCQGLIKKVDSIVISSWLDRLLVERLERKSETIGQTLTLNKNNWEHSFYIHLARNFGFKLNSEPFEMLAKATSSAYLSKHKNNLFQLEAMLFGQSGLLSKNTNEKYCASLLQEYSILKQKFSLSPINGHLWKFLRLHPSGFPTIRIAQFASLIYKSFHLFSSVLETRKLSEVENLFEAECSEYWQIHYVFGKESPCRSKKLGKAAIENIVINTIVPFLFIYGSKKNEDKYKDRAIRFMEQLEGEKNAIITKWKFLGMPVKTASNTQALLELKNTYCSAKQCLNCSIGNFLLRKMK